MLNLAKSRTNGAVIGGMANANYRKKDITLPPHNWEVFHQLQQEKNYFSAIYALVTGAGLVLMSFFGYIGFPVFASASRPLDKIQKLAQLIHLMRLLLREFEHLGVQIFPKLEVPGQKHPLDLLVRFPKKAHILISIRCKGESQIIYNEEKEALYVRRKKKKGIKVWKPCPLVELSDYTHWLNKNRQIFGISSKEVRNIPLAKVLVLWKPTLVGDHRDELYTTIESFKLLILKKKGVAFVITEKNIVNFIKAYLASYEGKEA